MNARSTKKRKTIAIMAVCAIICSIAATIYVLSYMPVRNYDYFHSDPTGDVENFLENIQDQDENIDIIFVQSHAEGDFIVLEMQVSGMIDNAPSRYHLIMVMNDLHENEEGYVYDFIYTNGAVEYYDCNFSVSNNSVTIFVPKDMFLDYQYMVGLEGYTDGRDCCDYCMEGQERYNPITYGVWSTISGAIIITGIAIIGKYKIYSLFFYLSSRLKHEAIPDQFVRGQIYGLIRARPGIHYTGIREILDVGNGTLAYHLSVLEKEEFVKSKRSIYAKQFYPTELPLNMNGLAERYPKGEVLGGIRYSEVQQKIIGIVRERPGITQADIVGKLKLAKQTVSYNVKKLVQYGTIRIEIDGNKNKCYLNNNTIEPLDK